ncbi:hypothetical protein SDC9_96862 [bioreactor metagenome]|uniref:Uncharacterized protein n=1 Tax=bioreactor metagenome TaxID=1076179 RepID=A0A645AAU3_9ZZZZ
MNLEVRRGAARLHLIHQAGHHHGQPQVLLLKGTEEANQVFLIVKDGKAHAAVGCLFYNGIIVKGGQRAGIFVLPDVHGVKFPGNLKIALEFRAGTLHIQALGRHTQNDEVALQAFDGTLSM